MNDLQLDPQPLLEIGVDVDYEFKLGVAEEAMRGLDSVQAVRESVARHRGSCSEHAFTAKNQEL